MCVCFLKCGAGEWGETSVLSLGRIIYGSFAAFLPSMTSRLQDVASAADPVLSGCVSRQGPASPSGPAPRLTDDNTATLCLRELWEKKIGRPDPLFFFFFFFSLSPPWDRAKEFCRAWSRETVEGREGGRQRKKRSKKNDPLRCFSVMAPWILAMRSGGLGIRGSPCQLACCVFEKKKNPHMPWYNCSWG